jgi:hypothetical protein
MLHPRLISIKRLIRMVPFEAVAKHSAISTKTLSRWVDQFNEVGIDGITDREGIGRPARSDREKAPADTDCFECSLNIANQ